MTHSEGHTPHPEHGHGGHGAAPPLDFTADEVASLHTSDTSAARAIVGLMAGIFSVGVLLYLFVLWTCL